MTITTTRMVGRSGRLTLDEELGATIQALMFRRRVTQAQVAQRLGIGQSTVSAKLRGRVSVSIHDLYAIADLLGVDPSALLPEGGEEHARAG